MTEVNEEIVKAYYEAQGYLVKTDHYYVKKKFSEEGNKTGQGPSDIDLIIIHPKNYDKAIVSVKGWHNDVVRKSNLKKWYEKDYMKLKIDKQANEAGIAFFGTKKFRKILVLSCIDEKDYLELKTEMEKYYGYDEVIDFPTIIKELIEGSEKKNIEKFNQFKHYRDSEFLQTLRLFIKYYLKKKDKSVLNEKKNFKDGG